MVDSKWPEYLPGWHDDIYAIGMISLNYCQLETMFGYLFAEATGMGQQQVEAFFQRLQNDARLKVFDQLTGARADIPDHYKDLWQHFAKGHQICAENRNAIMHSRHGGRFFRERDNAAGLLLSKFHKTGIEVTCPCTLADLRRVADDIHAFAMFGAALTTDTRISINLATRGDPRAFQLTPSLDKPSLPSALVWKPRSDHQPQKPQL